MKNILSYEKFLLEEGGNAVSGRRIKQTEVYPIYDRVSEILTELGLEKDVDFSLVGSAGKKKDEDTSGDLDIVIDRNKLCNHFNCELDDLYDIISDILIKKGITKIHKSKGFKEVSFGFPVNSPDDIVQVDFMFAASVEWGKFAHMSADYRNNESKYKALYKNSLLTSIIDACFKKTTHSIELPDGEKIDDEIEKYSYRLMDGIYKIRKSYRGAKPNTIKKTPVTLSEFDELVSHTPTEVIDLFFDNADIKDFSSFEKLFNLLMSNKFKFPEKRDEIIESTIEDLDNRHFELPSELEPYVEKSRNNIALKVKKFSENQNKLKKNG